MNFLYPAGLWALLGVAVLLLVYLLRPRYEQRTLTSTWLWKLSERFRKKQLPIQRAKRLLVFLMQLLMIVLGVLLIAQPRFALKGTGKDYVAIIDASASMRMEDAEGKTRFDRAREKILQDVAQLDAGSAMTVISADAQAVMLIERTQVFGEVEYALSQVEPGWSAGDLDGALALAQEVLWARPKAEVLLYTDKAYAQTENLTVVTLEDAGEWNAAVTAMKGRVSPEGTTFETTIVSYGRDADLTAALYVDDQLQAAQTVFCADGVLQPVTWKTDRLTYTRARVILTARDALTEDNEFWLTSQPANSINVMLLSAEPFYLENVLKAFPTVKLDVFTSEHDEDDVPLSGYDIYIFDECVPPGTPTDGAVWFINAPHPAVDTAMLFGETLVGAALTPVRSFTDETLSVITRYVGMQNVRVSRFREVVKLGRMTPVVMVGEMPAILAGRSSSSRRLISVMFSLSQSNLPLQADFVLLISGMLEYSLPTMLPTLHASAGEVMTATVLPFTYEIYLEAPDGEVIAVPCEGQTTTFTLQEPGCYTMLQKRPNDASKYSDFFISMPVSESDPGMKTHQTALTLTISGEETETDASLDLEYLYNPLPWLAGLLLLILLLECVVVNREQF